MALRGVVLVALVTLISGCVSPGGTPPPAENDATALVFELRDVTLSCQPPATSALALVRGLNPCFEPTIAIDPSGRIYVANVRTGDIAVSDDDGASWGTIAAPPPPADFHAWRSDVTLHAAPSGRVYWSAITLQTVQGPGLPHVLGHTSGVQVAWSDDQGASWTSTHLTTVGSPPTPMVSPDRQWLVTGPGSDVYLTFASYNGDWTVRSDDGGVTWTTWAQKAGGPPLVVTSGTVLVGNCDFVTGTFSIHRSTDRGVTYATGAVASGGCFQWPVIAEAPDGALFATWWAGRDIFGAVSRDDGKSWGPPIPWAKNASVGAWPLIDSTGKLTLVWIGPLGNRAVHVATGPFDGAPTLDRVVSEPFDTRRSAQSTDYAVGALTPDGRVTIPYAQPSVIRLAIETAA